MILREGKAPFREQKNTQPRLMGQTPGARMVPIQGA